MSEHPGDGGPPPPDTSVTGRDPRPDRADAAHDAPTTSHFGEGVPEGEPPAGDTATSRPAAPADPYTSPSPDGPDPGASGGPDSDRPDAGGRTSGAGDHDDAVRQTVGAGTQDPPSGEGQFSATSAGYDVAPEASDVPTSDEPTSDDEHEGRP